MLLVRLKHCRTTQPIGTNGTYTHRLGSTILGWLPSRSESKLAKRFQSAKRNFPCPSTNLNASKVGAPHGNGYTIKVRSTNGSIRVGRGRGVSVQCKHLAYATQLTYTSANVQAVVNAPKPRPVRTPTTTVPAINHEFPHKLGI